MIVDRYPGEPMFYFDPGHRGAGPPGPAAGRARAAPTSCSRRTCWSPKIPSTRCWTTRSAPEARGLQPGLPRRGARRPRAGGSSTGGPSGCTRCATTRSTGACSPTSVGSTWPRLLPHPRHPSRPGLQRGHLEPHAATRSPAAWPKGLQANGRPLVFFHFSGFDSGAQKVMLDKFGGKSPRALRAPRVVRRRVPPHGPGRSWADRPGPTAASTTASRSPRTTAARIATGAICSGRSPTRLDRRRRPLLLPLVSPRKSPRPMASIPATCCGRSCSRCGKSWPASAARGATRPWCGRRN